MSGEPHKFENPVVDWVDQRLPVISTVHHALFEYPVPKNLNWWWGFGSLASVFLVLQIVTGIILVMHYTPHTDLAFASVEHIMRDVNNGWLIRYMHMNGASFFFIVVYIHMFRGLYYGSYKAPRELLWIIGVVIVVMSGVDVHTVKSPSSLQCAVHEVNKTETHHSKILDSTNADATAW